MINALPETIRNCCAYIVSKVREAGGRALIVGGCVRDFLLGLPSKDVDIEIYGLEIPALEKILKKRFNIIEVGKSFGVFKITNLDIDIALPRSEISTGSGHKDFSISIDPFISVEQAALRRDFTINAIALDPITNEIIDAYHGQDDLKNRILRHTSEKFSEDPLRVLRAMQFAARFELNVAPETLSICNKITPQTLPKERIFEEWKKLILKGKKPSIGLDFLKKCGWIQYYPELKALIGCDQNPVWHPEGDVWVHTLHCMDSFAKERIHDEWEDLIVGFAVLCHDLGKPTTSKMEQGRIRSKGHEKAGEGFTRSFLTRMTYHKALIQEVIPLVGNHLRPLELYKVKAGDSAIRRLAKKVLRIDRLVRVAKADMGGRPPMQVNDFPEGHWLLERAEALAVKDTAPKPIVQGRHLIQIGKTPGPSFKPLLTQCYEAQLDGAFSNIQEGLVYLKKMLKKQT
jgi:tRNA nucleotidyltransferase (CCA-adding enzyme)